MKRPRELTHVAAKVKGKLTHVFAPHQWETLAQQSRFIQRSTSKLTGQDFVELMTTAKGGCTFLGLREAQ